MPVGVVGVSVTVAAVTVAVNCSETPIVAGLIAEISVVAEAVLFTTCVRTDDVESA